MSVITTIQTTDVIANSRADINTNFSNLNAGKAEISGQVFTGTVSATNLSGTNTGDQTISDATITTTDVTTNNVTSTKHGFTPKSPANAAQFLNGAATPAFALVKDSDLSTSDITTNDVSSTKHGFAPKGDGTTTKFLNANGAYSTPASAVYKNGTTTRNGNTASSAQTIAHGVGSTPKFVRITVEFAISNSIYVRSTGVYNGTTNSCVYMFTNQFGGAGSATTTSVDNTNGVHMEVVTGGTNFGIITFDSTNITITWTVSTGVGNANMNILWEAIG